MDSWIVSSLCSGELQQVGFESKRHTDVRDEAVCDR